MTDRSVAVRLRLEVASYIASAKQAKAATVDLTNSTLQTAEKHKQAFTRAGIAIGAVGAAAGLAGAKALSAFANFDQAMSGVQAATHASSSAMGSLRDAALEAGARTVFSASEAADAIEQLAKAGVSTQDVLGGGLNGALDLAAAGSLAVGDAAEIAATAMTQFKLSGAAVPHIADLLAAGAGKAQGEVSDLAMALKQSGLVASQMGLSVEETTGTLAAFASAGLLGSDAGTSFRTMLLRLTNPTDEAADLMRKLGISVYNAQGQFVGMPELAGQLSGRMQALAPATRNAALATIFGSDAIRAANVLYGQGAAGIDEWIDKVDDQGYAAETAGIKLDNLKGDVEAFTGSLETAFIKSGSAANDFSRGIVQGATGIVNAYSALPGGLQTTVAAFAGLTAATGLAGGGFLVLAPRIAETREAMQTLQAQMPRTTAAMRGLGRAAAIGAVLSGVTLGLNSLFDALADGGPKLNELTDSLADWVTTGAATGALARVVGDDFEDLAHKLKLVNDNQLVEGILKGGFGDSIIDIRSARNEIDSLDKTLAGLVAANHGELAARMFQAIKQNAGDIPSDKLASTFDDYTDSLHGASAETKLATPGFDALGGVQDTLKGRIVAATDALKAQADQLRASYDPAFAMQKAIQGQKDAQDELHEATAGSKSKAAIEAQRDYTAAVKAHGKHSHEAHAAHAELSKAIAESAPGTQRAKDAQWALFESTVDLQGAALGLREAVVKGTITFAESKTQLDDWVQKGLLTQGQADAMERSIHNVVDTANTLTKTPAKATVTATGVDGVKTDLKTVQDYLQGINGTLAVATVRVLTPTKEELAYAGGTKGFTLDAVPPVKGATGGWVSGPGGPRDDLVAARLSSGEFVVNARDAARNGPALEQMNSGRRFADGGWVSGGPRGGAGMSDAQVRRLEQALLSARPLVVQATGRDLSERELIEEAVFANRTGRFSP